MTWSINKPILVPYDFSEHAIEAARKAVRLADNPSQVYCVHVLPLLTPVDPGVTWAVVDDEFRVQHAMDNMKSQLPVEQFGNINIETRFGDPGTVVTDRAKELDCELIVVGSHGRSGLVRWMLGSVAERVTRLASCPVLIVKLPAQPVKAAAIVKTAQLAVQ